MGKIPQVGDWYDEQLEVINSPPEARLLVDAGPGTGKTAVACARLSKLIKEDDVEPSNTWMISFTRTAVAEIRARLYSYTGDDAFGVRIATVDSHAWSIHSGHDADAKLTGSYEENISRVIELLKEDEDVADELSQIEHLIVDEAQDLVGERSELVYALIGLLPTDCGITVFSDQAQAIYDFSNNADGGYPQAAGKPLTERLRSIEKPPFSTKELKTIHRTSSPGLTKIFSEVRRRIIYDSGTGEGLHAETVDQINELADENGIRSINIEQFSRDDLILFRSRAEVLMTSQFCDDPHRLRLSGYGATLPVWLGLCFWDFTTKHLGRKVFFDLWAERIENQTATEYGSAEAWECLMRIAGSRDDSVDMDHLRRRLGRTRPPVEIALSEYGLQGPIVGTIHASKGREANRVTLMMPIGSAFNDGSAEAEEARVLFVGATRARDSLAVGERSVFRASSLPSGRAFKTTRKGSVMVEVGREGDLSPQGLVGRADLTEAQALAAQEYLGRLADVVVTYRLKADPELDWRYRIFPDSWSNSKDNDTCIGAISPNLRYDLWELLKIRGEKNTHIPALKVRHIRAQGSATLVLPPDESSTEALNEPWASSGFMLKPRIVAFPPIYFNKRRGS